MWNELKQKGIKLPKMDYKEIDKKLDLVLREMEKEGIEIDVSFLTDLSDTLEKKLKKIEEKIIELAGEKFNVNSPIQLSEILFEKLRLPKEDIKKSKNGYSTAAGELKKIQHEHKIIKYILEYRELAKLISTYLKPLPLLVDENNRLHTTYGHDTTTGRMTSSEPNLQNIPVRGSYGAEIRRAFVASKGMQLISADYSQIELRVVACLADDKTMKEAFSKKEDIHSRTASEIFGKKIGEVNENDRRIAKTVNFGVLYGMSPYGLSQSLGIEREKAAEFIMRYFSIHKGIKDYCTKMIMHARDEGYVETLFGFRRYLPNINAHYRNLADMEERMAINTPVQGTAAEILKIAMINLSEELKKVNKKSFRARMLLTIHDEVIVEAKDEYALEIAELVKRAMEKAVQLCVPIEVEVKMGKNWLDAKKVNF